MDEEDLEELRNSKRIVDTTEEMDLTGGTETEIRKRMGTSINDEYVCQSIHGVGHAPTSVFKFNS